MATVEKVFELTFSDLEMGHPELGYMSREDCRDADEEDIRYRRFLFAQGYHVLMVYNGKAKVEIDEELEAKKDALFENIRTSLEDYQGQTNGRITRKLVKASVREMNYDEIPVKHRNAVEQRLINFFIE